MHHNGRQYVATTFNGADTNNHPQSTKFVSLGALAHLFGFNTKSILLECMFTTLLVWI